MLEAQGKLSEGITLIYGQEKSGKTAFCNSALDYYTSFGKAIFLCHKPDLELISNLDKVFIYSPKDYSDLTEAIELAFKIKPKVLIIDTISEIYRRERAKKKGLAKVLNLLSKAKFPILLISDTYLDFKTQKEKVPAFGILKYACKTIIKLERKGCLCKASKLTPVEEQSIFEIEIPTKKIKEKSKENLTV